MISALENGPKYEGTVYRGAIISDERFGQLSDLKEGDTIKMNGFVSTSVDEKVASYFAPPSDVENPPGTEEADIVRGVVYTVDGGKGSCLGELSGVPGEKEVVLPHGASYKVLGTHQVSDSFINVHLRMA